MSDTVIAQIQKIIDEEVKVQVNKKLSNYAERISARHSIPLRLLLEDIGSEIKVDQCLGVSKSGKRCKFHGGASGYCKRHQEQKKPEIAIYSENKHTHPPSILFQSGCPVCEKRPKEKMLISI